MTIKSLRECLNELAAHPELDEFQVEFTDSWGPSTMDSDTILRVDIPVAGSVIDSDAQEFILVGLNALKFCDKIFNDIDKKE